MKEITEEVNKLALEILEDSKKFESSVTTLQNLTKREALNHSFNFIDYTSKIYAFRRFYPFTDNTLLSQEAVDFYNKTKSILEQSKEILNNTQELPKDVQDFLNIKK